MWSYRDITAVNNKLVPSEVAFREMERKETEYTNSKKKKKKKKKLKNRQDGTKRVS